MFTKKTQYTLAFILWVVFSFLLALITIPYMTKLLDHKEILWVSLTAIMWFLGEVALTIHFVNVAVDKRWRKPER